MHRVLGISEILYNIFLECRRISGHCRYPGKSLAFLARTCRAFKEPALDVLWVSLRSLDPLVRCLPEACHQSSMILPVAFEPGYGLSRPPTQTEWDTLRSYTRRIRFIRESGGVRTLRLEPESYRLLSNTPTAEPLFPNLRNLQCTYTWATMHLWNLPLPSLVSLTVTVWVDSSLFQDSPKAFPAFSPNINYIFISLRQGSKIIKHSYMSRWQNLHYVNCFKSSLDVDALVHLSHTPALNTLTCALGPTFPDFDSPPSFSNLLCLTLEPAPSNMVAQFLSQTRLPALVKFHACICDGPPVSRQALSSVLNSLRVSNVDLTIKKLTLLQEYPKSDLVRSEAIPLNLEQLWPCMKFGHLNRIDIDIECNVDLSDNDLLTLASAWPRLGRFRINAEWGWNSQSGITPGGLVRLLQMCQSLFEVALRMDTRGYTHVPPDQAREHLGLAYTRDLHINVLDAAVEKESLPAIVDFFSGVAACFEPGPFSQLRLYYWGGERMPPDTTGYERRWTRATTHIYGFPYPGSLEDV